MKDLNFVVVPLVYSSNTAVIRIYTIYILKFTCQFYINLVAILFHSFILWLVRSSIHSIVRRLIDSFAVSQSSTRSFSVLLFFFFSRFFFIRSFVHLFACSFFIFFKLIFRTSSSIRTASYAVQLLVKICITVLLLYSIIYGMYNC